MPRQRSCRGMCRIPYRLQKENLDENKTNVHPIWITSKKYSVKWAADLCSCCQGVGGISLRWLDRVHHCGRHNINQTPHQSDLRCRNCNLRAPALHILPQSLAGTHDDVMEWKHFSHYWPFVRGIHRSPVVALHKGPVMRSFDVSFDVGYRMAKKWIWLYKKIIFMNNYI